MGSKVIGSVTKILKATSGRLFGRVTSGTGHGEELSATQVRTLLSISATAEVAAAYQPIGSYAAASHTHTASQVTDFSEATDDRVAALLAAGTNITITYNDAANTLTIASTASGLSGTGGVDNAALRADGTGGATLQNSAWIINDNLTASPNNTVNHACIEATGGTTNVSVSIKPKGTGAFCLSVPDGTSTGGNARGANAVDLQTARLSSTAVASGQFSFLAGYNGTASGLYSAVTGGNANSATGGNSATVTGGNNNTSSNDFTRSGGFFVSDQYGMDAWSSGGFANFGSSADIRIYRQIAKQKTTSATPVRMQLNGLNQTALYTSIPSGSVLLALIKIAGAKSDGTACAAYVRKVAIKNVGGNTQLVGSVETIGTDIEDNPLTGVSITADNTNDALDITVTGIASETWRWAAVVEALEIGYGT